MTIEDLPDPSTEGDSLSRQYQYFIQGSEGSVTYSISAAPMPSECGKEIFIKGEFGELFSVCQEDACKLFLNIWSQF